MPDSSKQFFLLMLCNCFSDLRICAFEKLSEHADLADLDDRDDLDNLEEIDDLDDLDDLHEADDLEYLDDLDDLDDVEEFDEHLRRWQLLPYFLVIKLSDFVISEHASLETWSS